MYKVIDSNDLLYIHRRNLSNNSTVKDFGANSRTYNYFLDSLRDYWYDLFQYHSSLSVYTLNWLLKLYIKPKSIIYMYQGSADYCFHKWPNGEMKALVFC